MAIDDVLTYRVRVDDSDFQAKLTQMRASLDATFSGAGLGMGGGFGFGMPMANIASYYSNFQGGPIGSGVFGMQPFSYTPPPMALTPHGGMVALHQGFLSTISGAFTGMPLSGTVTMMQAGEYQARSLQALSDSIIRGSASVAAGSISAAGGIAGGMLGSILGGAIAGPIGGFIGALFGSGAGVSLTNPYTGAMSDQIRLSEYVKQTSFRYMTGHERNLFTDRGFTRDAANEISRFLMSYERENFTLNMADIENILSRGTDAGLFEGTRDVEDFKNKFRNLVENVKRITTTLNTTVAEGIEVIRQYKMMGMTSAADISALSNFSAAMGLVAGRTPMEMTTIGMQGAEIYRGTGIQMKAGFIGAQLNAAMVNQAYTLGVINADQLAQGGGVEGVAATLTANALSGLQSGVGQTMLRAMADYSGAVPRLDPRRLTGDLFTSVDAAIAANQNPIDILRFNLNQTRMINEFNERFGGMGTQVLQLAQASQLATAGSFIGLTGDDRLKFAVTQMGLDPNSAAAQTLMMQLKNPERALETFRAAGQQAAVNRGLQMFVEKSPFAYLKEYVSDVAATYLVDPISRPLSSLAQDVGSAFEKIVSDAIGLPRVSRITRASKEVLSKIDTSDIANRNFIIDATGMITDSRLFEQEIDSYVKKALSDVADNPVALRKIRSDAGLETMIGGRKARIFSSEAAAQRYGESIGGGAVIFKRGMPNSVFGNAYIAFTPGETAIGEVITDEMIADERKNLSGRLRREISLMDWSGDETDVINRVILSGLAGNELRNRFLDGNLELSQEDRTRIAAILQEAKLSGAKVDNALANITGRTMPLGPDEIAAKQKELRKAYNRFLSSGLAGKSMGRPDSIAAVEFLRRLGTEGMGDVINAVYDEGHRADLLNKIESKDQRKALDKLLDSLRDNKELLDVIAIQKQLDQSEQGISALDAISKITGSGVAKTGLEEITKDMAANLLAIAQVTEIIYKIVQSDSRFSGSVTLPPR